MVERQDLTPRLPRLQVVEFNPQLEGVLDEVLASKERQKEFLFHNTYPFSKVTSDNRKAARVTYVEAFEIAEYGRQLRDDEIREFFPMLGPSLTISRTTSWLDSGLDVQTGQVVEVRSEGTTVWKGDGREQCDPATAREGSQRLIQVRRPWL